ncbi:MAG: LuxR C-terminal-related transcriptional regulator [Armatimonadota bacterium]|nr:LuxR C-terminal-related transcriptional regulator [Armatimonadota bacterium]
MDLARTYEDGRGILAGSGTNQVTDDRTSENPQRERVLTTRKDWFTWLADVSDALCAVSLDSRIMAWNRAAEELFGVKAAQALGRRCYEIVGGRDPSGRAVCRHNCAVLRAAAEGRCAVPEEIIVFPRNRGSPRWLTTSLIVLRHRSRPVAILHLFRDVTKSTHVSRVGSRILAVLTGRDEDMSFAPALQPLTPREREVLLLLCQGVGTQEIATRLSISRATVRNHVRSILSKLGVHTRLEAVSFLLSRALKGLVPLGGE